MEFGICFKGSMEDNRMKNIVQQAEIAGFKYGMFFVLTTSFCSYLFFLIKNFKNKF